MTYFTIFFFSLHFLSMQLFSGKIVQYASKNEGPNRPQPKPIDSMFYQSFLFSHGPYFGCKTNADVFYPWTSYSPPNKGPKPRMVCRD